MFPLTELERARREWRWREDGWAASQGGETVTTPSEPTELGDDASGIGASVEVPHRTVANAKANVPARDWHRLAATTPPVKPRGRRGTVSGPRPGQLVLGDLLAPTTVPTAPPLVIPTAPANPPVRLTPFVTVTGAPPKAPIPDVRRGRLLEGRFPSSEKPGTTGRVRPADWCGVGARPAMVAFELPPPAAPEDADHDRTLPVYATKDLELRLGRLRSGGTIEIEPGEYRGTLTIRTPVTLRALGGEVRIRSTTGPAVCLKGCGATLMGLTLQSEHSDAVVVESGAGRPTGSTPPGAGDQRLELIDCQISGDQSGVIVQTAQVRLGIDGGSVMAGEGSAIRLAERGIASVAGGRITRANAHGIAGERDVRLVLIGTTIEGCGGAGVRLGGQARLWMDDGDATTITGNHGSGIALGPGGTGAIAGATITANGGWGIIAPGSDLTVRGGTIHGNGLGDIKR